MRSRRIPMSVEEYFALPPHLGWKQEYYDGAAHITPSHRIASVCIAVEPRSVSTIYALRRVVPEDAPALKAAFYAAFRDSADYCDYSAEDIRDSGRRCIERFFSGKDSPFQQASYVAVPPVKRGVGRRIVGAALLTRERSGAPYLDLLFIHPRYWRQGVATALVSAAMNALYESGERLLRSAYLYANEESEAWHRRFGFIEEPDLSVAQERYRIAMFAYRQKMEDSQSAEAEREEAERRVQFWKERVEQLETYGKVCGFEAVHPVLRYGRLH